MTRPDLLSRSCWLIRIALRPSCVHLEASLCQGKVRPHTSCCLVARIPVSSPVQNRYMVAEPRYCWISVNWDSMAVSVIDTQWEFKLVPYSGDDEHWPRWVLKFEAWSELVGWQCPAGQQGWRAGSMASIEVGVWGKSGNRQAALLRRVLNPRAAWEADTRNGRSVLHWWTSATSKYACIQENIRKNNLKCGQEYTCIPVNVSKSNLNCGKEVIDEARNKGRKVGIGTIINKMVGDRYQWKIARTNSKSSPSASTITEYSGLLQMNFDNSWMVNYGSKIAQEGRELR